MATATSRILVNGRPGRPVQHRRGVRQGDPLSPMLFILVMEVLHQLFLKATDASIIHRLEVPTIKYQCSIYADDVIIFARPTQQEARAINRLLEIFGDASGLRTNLAKCSITPIFADDTTLIEVQQILGVPNCLFSDQISWATFEYQVPSQIRLATASGIRCQQAPHQAWIIDGQKRTPHLGQISDECGANLCNAR